MMPSTICSKCRSIKWTKGPEDQCPVCLLMLGLDEPQKTERVGSSKSGSGVGELENPGHIIDGYKLVRPIGEGGFGKVWLAEQHRPIRRLVALKIVKLGMDTRQVVARFATEQQALALMDHSCIAKVFDAGATTGGRPYFIMELVDGVPIVEYCDRRKLGIRERVQLFCEICHAVQHAHQKGIIHRDLKPSNILISGNEEKPTPKIIDFGIAKATAREFGENEFRTQENQLLGTPAYMSPEQADGGLVDIDTRSDIYSLGAILYELLIDAVSRFFPRNNSGPFFANGARGGLLQKRASSVVGFEQRLNSPTKAEIAGASVVQKSNSLRTRKLHRLCKELDVVLSINDHRNS